MYMTYIHICIYATIHMHIYTCDIYIYICIYDVYKYIYIYRYVHVYVLYIMCAYVSELLSIIWVLQPYEGWG